MSWLNKLFRRSTVSRGDDRQPLKDAGDEHGRSGALTAAIEHMMDNPGTTLGESLAVATDGANLVDGRQTWELAEAFKHDLEKMKACCEAEIATSRKTGLVPAPYYFERVAILNRKAKNYAEEIAYCQMYIDLVTEHEKEHGGNGAIGSSLARRLGKAQELLAKQQGRGFKGEPDPDDAQEATRRLTTIEWPHREMEPLFTTLGRASRFGPIDEFLRSNSTKALNHGGKEYGPRHCASMYRAAGEAAAKSNLAKAIEYYEEASKIDATNTAVLMRLGKLYIEAKQPESARSMFLKVLQISPEHKGATTALSRI